GVATDRRPAAVDLHGHGPGRIARLQHGLCADRSVLGVVARLDVHPDVAAIRPAGDRPARFAPRDLKLTLGREPIRSGADIARRFRWLVLAPGRGATRRQRNDRPPRPTARTHGCPPSPHAVRCCVIYSAPGSATTPIWSRALRATIISLTPVSSRNPL